MTSWKRWARSLKRNTHALWLAGRDPRVPLLAKLIIGATVAYALSPVDLIPDFIPVLGYLDDIVLLPLGLWMSIRLVPSDVWEECKARAAEEAVELPRNWRAAVVIVFIWTLAVVGPGIWLWSSGFRSA